MKGGGGGRTTVAVEKEVGEGALKGSSEGDCSELCERRTVGKGGKQQRVSGGVAQR